MNSPEELKLALDTVLVPGVKRSLLQMNLIKNISAADGKAEITLFNAALMKGTREWLSEQIKEALSKMDGLKAVNVSYEEGKPVDLNKIKNVIAVMSGKGGVGKSLVSGLAAIALRRQGYEVGILDGDITGPSIPKMFGVSGMPPVAENGLLPIPSRSGVQIMSLNLLLPAEDDAVIWRGPLIGQTIKQFWEDVLWGNLDYLIVDLPPGTADAPLTTLQQLPISGIIIVFTPQDLTAMVVRKAVNMAKKMDKKIIGVVENMSYLYIPELNKKMELFGKSRGEEMSQVSGAPLLGILPIDPELVKLCDEGGIERYSGDAYSAFAQKLVSVLK
jgi:ATP-binding protein involved in chromosome partitioning